MYSSDCMSEMLTVRVSKKTKEEMGNYKINWSEYIRETVRNKLTELRRERAFKEMDKMRSKIPKSKLNMADEVIKWRKRH